MICRITTVFLIFSLVYHISFAQTNEREVEIRIFSAELSDSDSVFISGNLPKLGSWNPSKIKMSFNPSGFRNKKFYFQPGTLLEFKFTRGSWEREALDSSMNIYPNFVHRVTGDTVLSFILPHWKSGQAIKPKGQITGTVIYHPEMGGEKITPRNLIVWVPPDYMKYPDKRYPVLYMNDGQNLFDPETSTFKVDWGLDEVADSLLKSGEIEPLIIVGINNSSERSKEYLPGATSENYMRFVAETVKPFIDSSYRTNPDRNNTAVGGSSAGGTVSFMLHNRYNQVFGKAICMSPAFRIGKNVDCVSTFRQESIDEKKFCLYIDNGGIGLDEELQPGIDEMIAALKEKGLTAGKDFFWVKASEARHNEAAWNKRIPGALKLLFGSK